MDKDLEKQQCTGGNNCELICKNQARWINQNGVIVCEYHKLLLDAFTWGGRDERDWQIVKSKGKE